MIGSAVTRRLLNSKRPNKHSHPKLKQRILNIVAALLIAVATVLIPSQPLSAAIGGKRAAVLSPFMGGASWFLDASEHDPAGVSSGYGFAWDLIGGSGPDAPVYPRIKTGDGALTLKIDAIGNNPSDTGKYVVVVVKVSNVIVGKVRYVHLTNVPAFTVGDVINTTTQLGKTASSTCYNSDNQVTTCVPGSTCYGFHCSDYWQVRYSNSIHTHVDFQRACYGSSLSSPAGPSTGLTLLSNNYATDHDGACDATELASVAAATVDLGTPALFTANNGDIWMAGINIDGELYSQKYTASTGIWASPTLHSSGWAPNSSPAITMDANGKVWLAAVKSAGTLYARYFDTGWNSWVQVDTGVSPNAGLNLVARRNGNTNVSMAYVKSNGNVYHATGNTSNWVTGVHFSGSWSTTSTPGIIVDETDKLWMAAIKNYGHLYVWKVTSSGDDLHDYDVTDISTNSGIDMVARPNNVFSMVFIDDAGQLIFRTLNTDGTGSAGTTLGLGNWAEAQTPAITTDSNENLWVAAIKTNGNAYSFMNNGSWQPSESMGTGYAVSTGIDIQRRTTGTVSAASIDEDSDFNHRTWDTTTSVWGDPTPHAFE